MKVLDRLLSMLAVPLFILNMFGGIISGIWLAILGKWGLIGYGIIAMMVSGMGLSFAMIPGLIFAAPAAVMLEKGNKVGGYFLGLLGTIYTVGILTIWCILVLSYYINHADANSIIPVLIWSYGIATGPIIWLSQKDSQSGNKSSLITTFFLQVAYMLSILAILLVGVSLGNVLVLFSVVMTVGLFLQFSVAYMEEKSRVCY